MDDLIERLQGLADGAVPYPDPIPEAIAEIKRLRTLARNKDLGIAMLRAQVRSLGGAPCVVENVSVGEAEARMARRQFSNG